MNNLKGNPFYDQLFETKKENSKKKRKLFETVAFWLFVSFVLSFILSELIFIVTVVVCFIVVLCKYATLVPDYESFYYMTFFPELLKHIGINDMRPIRTEKGRGHVRRSGLDILTNGRIMQLSCFEKDSNEFNYFGYYRKSERRHNGKESRNVTTFDGLFFLKEVEEKRLFDFRVVAFKPQDENVFNKKGYSGAVFLNYEKYQLSDHAIDLLAGLYSEFGKVYISYEEGYLGIQFLNFGTCYSYNLNPYLKKGEDTEDHFKIIELSKLDSKIAPVVYELLEDVAQSILKR